jgi:hypothetical protein
MPDSVKNKLDFLIHAAVYDCHTDDAALLDSLGVSSVNFSKAYIRRKKKILSEQKKKQEYNFKKIIRFRIIVAALITVSIILGSILSISAVRESLWKTIMTWYEKYIDVQFENEVSEATPPTTIEEVRKPTQLPEGCEEVEIYNDMSGVYIEYYKENNFLFFFQQGLMQDGALWINGENVTVSDVTINGYKAKLSQKNDNLNDCQIIWNDSEYYYMLSGNALLVDQMIEIANSVK